MSSWARSTAWLRRCSSLRTTDRSDVRPELVQRDPVRRICGRSTPRADALTPPTATARWGSPLGPDRGRPNTRPNTHIASVARWLARERPLRSIGRRHRCALVGMTASSDWLVSTDLQAAASRSAGCCGAPSGGVRTKLPRDNGCSCGKPIPWRHGNKARPASLGTGRARSTRWIRHHRPGRTRDMATS
jgi:hypothetical protein